MADKRQVKKSIKQLQRIKTWQLIILLILAAVVSATFLRLNNIGMVERRNAVIAADEAGNSEDIKNRLYDLQRYVSQHMNTTTDRVALDGQYHRDSQKAKDEAEAIGDGSSNGNVYGQAAAVCDPLGVAQGWRWPDPRYIACIDTELSKYPAANGPIGAIELPSASLYYHSFTSPLWSPDFAGFSLLVCAILVVLILARMISLLILKVLLRRHYSAV